jgi:transposase
VFADESGVSTLPPPRTTWARRGHTPRLLTLGRRRWLSLAGFICYHPARHSVLVHYTHRRKAFDTGSLIDALRGLHRFLAAPVVLVWDNLGAHHSAGMRGFLATQTGWLSVYALPSYAYGLNPADGLWGNLKTVDLANRVNTDLDDVERAVARGMRRIRRRPDLLWNFLTRCGLSPPRASPATP